MNAIFRRRSIRRYTDKQVSDEMINQILAAGMNAPSAGNEQPWHFIIIKDKETLKRLADFSPHSQMAKDAALAILVCADLNLERHKGYWAQDCSAATENMLIEVAELNLGAVWLGVFPVQDRVEYIRQQFQLPQNIVPFSVIPVGYPAQEMKMVNRYSQERVHQEKW
jgi:nitroreductase